ncbi:2-Hydroxyacid oxidase 1 isoform X2 [Nematostella vectensis]|uniref:2-Hydroxyacid oxidase 1 isoform X2 n=1 Tax=Nematostella vectensis TaxID=45351 RepID=UPI002076F036|nr:2-Hydroxyacid oxidase 1 isoform X2 [Nematostella vectensis]
MAAEPVCLDDFERLAKGSMSEKIYSFFASGADEARTIEENKEGFRRIKLRPRMLRGISDVDMRTTILGQPISMPICIAPTAMHRCAHPDGEIATVKAAGAADTCMALTIWTTTTLEEVAAAEPQALKWFLIYHLKEREQLTSLVRRAEKSGYKALVLVADAPDGGIPYHRSSKRNGRLLTKGKGPQLVHMEHCQIDPSVSWESVYWLKSFTKLPIVLKGILTPEDARLAVEHGVDGIIVSNHGGRQLDGVQATIDALPEIVKAVQGKLEVYMDGGVRLGTDVFKALALGARAVFIGRPVIWGLAYKGEEGVRQVLELLREELRLAMILSGCGSLDDVTSSYVIPANQSARL